ncbi:transposase-like protein [Corynebacterium diphtheriae C7 (beta)]|nr:transposase-like protein [Corynebacterium diphtheriae C7 (beta)]OLN19408.1 hypothetical protein BUE67_09240 [Corynebacterium diphtheriae]OLO13530.1 hypothetical protein BUV99_11230 [Corynebacterium diphtheriae]OLO21109.1 hypothetical protein BVH76_11280 [Corynebacterium diphtheriae]OLO21321.1 hypothetical protein BVH78_10980 [Corynebacterium diphtheriae]
MRKPSTNRNNIPRQTVGMGALAKVTALTQPDENKADQETGRRAFYDNAISTEYSHSVGIKKGTVG